jgi:hypothetical protein
MGSARRRSIGDSRRERALSVIEDDEKMIDSTLEESILVSYHAVDRSEKAFGAFV